MTCPIPVHPPASFHHDLVNGAFPSGNVIGPHELRAAERRHRRARAGESRNARWRYRATWHEIFTADDAGNWAIGGERGDVFESTDLTRPLSCGEVLSIARADDGTTAVSTARGGILLFKLTPDSRRYLGSIPFPSSHVALSRDGLILAASADLENDQSQADRSLSASSACRIGASSRSGRTAGMAHNSSASVCRPRATVSGTRLACPMAGRAGRTPKTYEL